MANEITLTASLSCNKPAIMASPVGRSVTGILYSMAGNAVVAPFTHLASHTAANAIPKGSIGSLGFATIFNSDAVHAVQLYLSTDLANPFAQIPPQGFNIISLYPSATYYTLAITADVACEIMLLSQ